MALEFSGGWLAITIVAFLFGGCLGFLVRRLFKRDEYSLPTDYRAPYSTAAPRPLTASTSSMPSYPQHAQHAQGPLAKAAPSPYAAKDTAPMSDTAKAPTAAPMTVIPEQPGTRLATVGVPAVSAGSGVAVLTVAPGKEQPPASALPGIMRGAQHKRDPSTASMYDVEDLDSDWERLLGSVDAMLAQAGKPGMSAKERAVAVKKLTGMTGTRGVDAALRAAVDEVARFRSWTTATPAART